MATKNLQLLLTESVDNLGIVGDVVTVRAGYARNFLLPRGLATEPSEGKLAALADKRAKAEAALEALTAERRKMIGKMEGLEITIERSCNDLGHLYGSVTQQDVSAALAKAGYTVKPREVRLPFTIKRVDSFDVLVKLASDMEASIKLHVKADRHIDEDERDEMEFDNEGNLIERSRRGNKGRSEAKPAESEPAAEAQDA
ncbi:MAG: 50S ribosomal protein L9 [Phycisphaerales bacterium]|nr:50S ribosomal protein L9 [Phycisphaerales bacterium]